MKKAKGEGGGIVVDKMEVFIPNVEISEEHLAAITPPGKEGKWVPSPGWQGRWKGRWKDEELEETLGLVPVRGTPPGPGEKKGDAEFEASREEAFALLKQHVQQVQKNATIVCRATKELKPEVKKELDAQKGGARVRKKALEEAALLFKVAKAFRALEADARRMAEGGQPVCDLSPDGELARLAEQAAGGSEPLAKLSPAVDALRAFSHWKDGMPIPDDAAANQYLETVVLWQLGERADGRLPQDGMRDVPLRRVVIGELAADCRACGAVAKVRADAILERETFRAGWRLDLAKAKVKLAKVTGDKAGYRKWKKKEKSERGNVRILEVARLLGVAGWTVRQVAEKLKVSESTVERTAREARERRLLRTRTAGRRGPGGRGKGGDVVFAHKPKMGGGRGGEIDMDEEAVRRWREEEQTAPGEDGEEEEGARL